MVAYTFGWRRGEVLQLRVPHVDLLNRTLCLDPGTTKNDQGRNVKMTTEVYELLKECVSGKRPDDFLFTRQNGKPVKDFRKKWRNACIALGLGRMECNQEKGRKVYVGLIPHDFRRTAVRNLERSGVSRSVAMAITGHKTESVYRRYAIVSESDLADAARKIEQRQNSYKVSYSETAEPVPASHQDSVTH